METLLQLNGTTLDLSHLRLNELPPKLFELISLTHLELNGNELLNIPKELGQLNALTHLDLSGNQLLAIPKEIGQLSSLIYLDLHNNQLLAIPKEIGQLNSLTMLDLSYNKLVNIPKKIGQLSSLTYLNLNSNQLLAIPEEIGQLSSLTVLDLSLNQLVNIPKEIGLLSSLTQLNLWNNKLTNIPKEIGQLNSLTILYLSYNQLTSLPIELIQLRHTIIYFYENPIEYIPPNLLRSLVSDRNDYQKVYSDGQNVHNHSIQDGISKSINYIMNQKPIFTEEQLNEFIIKNKYLSEPTKQLLFEYSENPDIHSRFGLSFSELLLNVFSLIENHQEYQENKEEIYSILNAEMADAQCKCFTGRVSRLVNCLNGFDPNIIIHISNSEQIGNIICLIQRQLEVSGEYSVESHQDLVRKELLERGYDELVINDWVNAITI
jgi:Leucine-rich repeat (LRR) protein